MTLCPLCGGPWEPYSRRGVAFYRHAPTCPHDAHEIARRLKDWAILDDPEHGTRWPVPIERPITPTERDLLTHAGYTPTDAATKCRVEFTGGLWVRTFPNLPAPPDLPDPTGGRD